jgi:hypothetical protein
VSRMKNWTFLISTKILCTVSFHRNTHLSTGFAPDLGVSSTHYLAPERDLGAVRLTTSSRRPGGRVARRSSFSERVGRRVGRNGSHQSAFPSRGHAINQRDARTHTGRSRLWSWRSSHGPIREPSDLDRGAVRHSSWTSGSTWCCGLDVPNDGLKVERAVGFEVWDETDSKGLAGRIYGIGRVRCGGVD